MCKFLTVSIRRIVIVACSAVLCVADWMLIL